MAAATPLLDQRTNTMQAKRRPAVTNWSSNLYVKIAWHCAITIPPWNDTAIRRRVSVQHCSPYSCCFFALLGVDGILSEW